MQLKVLSNPNLDHCTFHIINIIIVLFRYNLKNLKIILTRCDDLLKTREEMKVEMTGAPNNIVQHGDTVMEPKEENKYQELIDRLG